MKMEIGQVCVKTVGKEKGKYCVVVKKVDKNFVIVSGPKALTGVKRRRANVIHLQPLQYKLEIKEDVSDEELLEAWKNSGLVEKFGLKLPSAAELKKQAQAKEEKVESEEKVEKKEKKKAKKKEEAKK
ncbi:MAG: 50S ribosomal protein L14e [Candidatus Aenigmarchaeota archaeon]|jgi:large subunit ribosomal protein L14e|nr:50S ribosomal protein L14e [Candidatus Aenigmarchaeota archaeon]